MISSLFFLCFSFFFVNGNGNCNCVSDCEFVIVIEGVLEGRRRERER